MKNLARRAIGMALAGMAAVPVMTAASADDLRDALAARELVCEFRDGFRRNIVADILSPRASTTMRMYESVTPESAEALSSDRPGRRGARVRATAQALHLIEPLGASVRVTTITGCEAWKRDRNGGSRCIRFTARHAWHFDTNAHLDPDGAFERLPSGASAGVCEPWRID